MSKSVTFDAPESPGDNNEQQEMTIQEEYKLWRKNCHYMYDFVSETALTWPSLTCQWLPQKEITDEYVKANLILGTHTSGNDTNYLKLSTTKLPKSILTSKSAPQTEEQQQPKEKINSRLKIVKKFENDFEINRARFMPQSENIVACINGNGNVTVYNTETSEVKQLTHHKENGYGLSWNTLDEGLLLTSSDDKSIALWDAKVSTKKNTPVQVIKNHKDIVNDVEWHKFDANVFGSVSDDQFLFIYDRRSKVSPEHKVKAHNSGINSLSFSPFSQNLLATGGEDSNVCLFDIRRLDRKLHTMMGHSESITCLEWSPLQDGTIASGSQDRRIIIWDISKIGEEQNQDDADDGAPELFMMHAGHTGSVTDLSWNPYIPWTLASTADDNIVHIWKVSENLTNPEQAILQESDLE